MGTPDILAALERSRASIDRGQAPSSPGVYGIFLRDRSELQLRDGLPNGLIYIGMSGNLAAREYDMHFSSRNTGFSTLRRSIGALLKEELALVAMPRGSGRTESNYRNYRFKPDGEDRLTSWMMENLEVGIYPTGGDHEAVEKVLIAALQPPLCLTGWPNPEAGFIKALRKLCADDARSAHKRR